MAWLICCCYPCFERHSSFFDSIIKQLLLFYFFFHFIWFSPSGVLVTAPVVSDAVSPPRLIVPCYTYCFIFFVLLFAFKSQVVNQEKERASKTVVASVEFATKGAQKLKDPTMRKPKKKWFLSPCK
jgi:hypothetical protein